MSDGLDQLGFEEKQALLRLLVERIVVEGNKVTIEAIIPLDDKPGALVLLRPPGGNASVDHGLFHIVELKRDRSSIPLGGFHIY